MSKVTDEFDDLVRDENGVEPTVENPIVVEPLDAIKAKAGLVTAASLLDPDEDPDQGDFEPGRYKGFEILPESEWPVVKKHTHIKGRFYVRNNDTVGMVPWPGSMIVWPWEAAWERDLYRETVTSFLKEEKKEKPKR